MLNIIFRDLYNGTTFNKKFIVKETQIYDYNL